MLSFPIYAQFGVSGSFGVGSYNMGKLKDFNTSNQTISNGNGSLKLNQLENFPINQTISFDVFYEKTENLRLSAGITYLTTGSRLYAEDYSGIIKNDIIANSLVLNITASQTVFRNSWFTAGFYISPKILMGTTKFKSSLHLKPDYTEASEFKGKSTNYGLSSGVFLRKRVNRLEFFLKSGYHLDLIKGSLETSDGEYEILDQSGSALKNNWSGLRASIGLSVFLN